MDAIGQYIASLHNLTGHNKTAAVLGVPAGDRDACLICAHERRPTGATRRAVIRALSPDTAREKA